jgi:uncharacterized protein YlxW (UPF0749 family)
MCPGSDVSPDPGPVSPDPPSDAASSKRVHWLWRAATPVAAGLCGALFIVSADNAEGKDLRPGRYTDLAGLVSNEREQVTDLQERVSSLSAEVDDLANSIDDAAVRRLQRRTDALRGPAGLAPVTGPGVTITLSDAPADVINSSQQNINLLVVHQQDIQAVVNALWVGGAEAVTVQGQRIVTTTGIKCEGNAVQLDGVPYAQPYVISGVGDQAALLSAIERDEYLATYRDQALQPDIAVGWDLATQTVMSVPGYDGLTDLQYARVSAD